MAAMQGPWPGYGVPDRGHEWSDTMAADASEVGQTARRVQELAERLRVEGHQTEAGHLDSNLTLQAVERGFLFALRETCETVLTAIEAVDPVTQTMIENLRLEVEKHLRLSSEPKDA
jgi:hypothetical protein